jgi:hypothetical protein
MDKENGVHIHNGAFFIHKKEQNYIIFREMDVTRDHQFEHNKQMFGFKKSKHYMFSFICGI